MGKTYQPARDYICQFCNKSFKRYGNVIAKYCSYNCKNQSQNNKVKLICVNCSLEYEQYPSAIKWSKIRGNNFNFCSSKCTKEFKVGPNSNTWKGGRHITKRGYIKIRKPEHPNNIYGYCYEHRLVMEEHIGRYLTEHEDIHHINENKSDNRLENLELLTSSEHSKLTSKKNWETGKFKK